MRKAAERDVSRILEIYDDGKEYMRRAKIDQWTGGYPGREDILSDIDNGGLYVFEEDGIIRGAAFLGLKKEEPYENPDKGVWKTGDHYGTIHRIAVSAGERGSGFAGRMMKEIEDYFIEKGKEAVRVDTHPDNYRMTGFLKKHGYLQVTEITTARGNFRIGFEKKL